MSRWCDELPSEILVRLRAALRGTEGMVTDRDLYDALTDELWNRVAVAIPGRPDADGAAWWQTRKICHRGSSTEFRVVYFCRHADGPLDPNHRPVRLRHGFGETTDPRTRGGTWFYECSCGARDDELERVTLKCQRLPGPFWWPKSKGSGVLAGDEIVLPRFIVCPNAATVDDVEHAPGKILASGSLGELHFCICGCRYAPPGTPTVHRTAQLLDPF